MITANDALALLHKIGCTSISVDDQNLVSNNVLNSIDIMNLISAIEEDYNCSVDVDLIDVENFENCEAIAQIITNAIANS